MKYKVIAYLDYIAGHIDMAHLEGEVEAENMKELFQKFRDSKFKETFRENAKLVLDDWNVYETGDIIGFETELRMD